MRASTLGASVAEQQQQQQQGQYGGQQYGNQQYGGQQQQYSGDQQADMQPGPRVFAQVELYRQNDALTLSAIPAKYQPTNKGDFTFKAGAFMLSFAKGLQGTGGRPKAGEARFDWANKQVLPQRSACTMLGATPARLTPR